MGGGLVIGAMLRMWPCKTLTPRLLLSLCYIRTCLPIKFLRHAA